ncbi:MAG: hypothetical protein HYY25_15005 [Candidatus Wallbacteria bacterium]|nr:hypothetical protein [Candidatus Wallbacteria bacterium]
MRTDRRILVLSTLLSLTMAALPAPATPALYGSSGLIRIPTAYTLCRGEFDAAVDLHYARSTAGAPDVRFLDQRVVTGVFGDGDHGLELGVHRESIDAAAGSSTAITGKYRFPGILPLGAFAIGGRVNVGGQDQNAVYVVGSTSAAKSFAVHYGAGANLSNGRGLFSHYGGKDDGLDTDRFFAMFGAEMDWNDFKLNVDFNGDTMAYGINYFPADSVVCNVFYINNGDMERLTGTRQSVGLGVTVQF